MKIAKQHKQPQSKLRQDEKRDNKLALEGFKAVCAEIEKLPSHLRSRVAKAVACLYDHLTAAAR